MLQPPIVIYYSIEIAWHHNQEKQVVIKIK